MRTKALLGVAALAASAATCVAQSNVYSLNIVGYVNVDIVKGYNLVSIPLKPSDGNYNITNTIVMPAGTDSSTLFKWTGVGYSGNTPQWIEDSPGVGQWMSDAPMTVGLGEAVFINATAAGKITFVGEVATGALANTLAAGYNAVGNKVPSGEAWPGVDVGNDGDNVNIWVPATQSWVADWTYIAKVGSDPYGWTTTGTTFTGGPALTPGQGVFYFNTGSAINWTQNFNP